MTIKGSVFLNDFEGKTKWKPSLQAIARANAFPIVVWLVLRVWTWLWASIVNAFVPPSAEALSQYYGTEPLHDLLIAPWQRWDTIWYAKIAMEGYAADQGVHFPLFYPFLIRLVSPLLGYNAVAAGLVISSVAGLASFILLYQLGCTLFNRQVARRAILFLGAFPTAFFLFAAYTEPLFLAFVLGTFVSARRRDWLAAGLLGALAAMTRAQGSLLLLPLGVEFWLQYRRGELSLTRVWTLAPVLLGGIAQVAWVTYQFGSPRVWLEGEALMHHFALPWDTLAQGWRAVLDAPSLFEASLSVLDPLFALVLLATLVWSARRLPLSVTAYLAIVIAPSLVVITTYSDAYPMTSVSRFVLLAFPFFLLIGTLPKRWWDSLVLAFSFLIQTLLLVLFSAWVFVR